jgi:hypothetical protein
MSFFIRLALLGFFFFFFFFSVFDFEALLLFFEDFAVLAVHFLLRPRLRNLPIRFCADSVKFLDIISLAVTSGD